MHDDRPGESQRRARKKRWIALAMVVVLAIAGLVYLVWSEFSVERSLAAIRAAGYPTSFAELAEYTRLPAGVENAAGTYEDAFCSIVAPRDVNLPLFEGTEAPGQGEPLPEPMAEAISEYLQDNEECLALLREAGGVKHCRYEYDYVRMWPEVWQAKECARLLRLATLFHAHSGDSGAAVAFINDGLRLTNSLEREPGIVGQLVRFACIQTFVLAMEQGLNATSFSDEQLRKLDDGFRRARETLDLDKVLATERCVGIEAMGDRALLWRMEGSAKVMALPGVNAVNLVDYLDYMAACIEACKLAGTQRVTRLREVREGMERDDSLLHVAVRKAAPTLEHFAMADQRVQSLVDMARTAIAIERYRLAKGELPGRLEELVGEYLEAVPVDPFDDKPIKYRRMEPGYLLYSVGMDGKDDGGKERSAKKQPEETCDLTFIVTR